MQDCKNSKKQIERDTEKQLEKKNVELQKTVEEQESTRRLVKKLEVEIKDIKERQVEMMKMKNELLKTIEAKNSVITNLMFKENDYKKKVNEALQLVEAAFIEKDAALQREILIKGIKFLIILINKIFILSFLFYCFRRNGQTL